MATHTVAEGDIGSDEITLSALTVDTVTFTNTDLVSVEVINPPTNEDSVWYTLDGSTPEVGGGTSYMVPAGAVDSREPTTGGATVIKLISTGTPTIRVQSGR